MVTGWYCEEQRFGVKVVLFHSAEINSITRYLSLPSSFLFSLFSLSIYVLCPFSLSVPTALAEEKEKAREAKGKQGRERWIRLHYTRIFSLLQAFLALFG